jgi:hypothetical protein
MIPRRSPQFFQTLNAGLKAHEKDPRRVPTGNNPFEQPDIQQFARIRQETQIVPQYSGEQNAAPDMVTRSLPTKIQYIPWQATLAGELTPVLLVPKNPKRVSLLLSNRFYASGGVGLAFFFSFGFPLVDPLNEPVGMHLPLGGFMPYPAGTCPINEVWAWILQPAVPGAFIALAYEGIEAVEANQS